MPKNTDNTYNFFIDFFVKIELTSIPDNTKASNWSNSNIKNYTQMNTVFIEGSKIQFLKIDMYHSLPVFCMSREGAWKDTKIIHTLNITSGFATTHVVVSVKHPITY